MTATQQRQSPTLSMGQGVALIFGTNIGAGILSLPYAARNGGFLALIIALLLAGTLTTIAMLYIAEVSLRTSKPLQLAGLAERYLGGLGRWLVFAAVMINAIGALTAYASGSGLILHNLLGIPPLLGSVVFFALGSFVMFKGLHATGWVEAMITAGMATIIFVLCFWTILGPGINFENLLVLHPFFIIPIVNLAIFTFMAQYIVPELARGLDHSNPSVVPKTITAGMGVTGLVISLVPFAALGFLGKNVSEVVTVSWGEALGPVAYYAANIFALLAMFTSFIAIGYTAMRNVIDIGRWDEHGPLRWLSLGVVVIPPFVIALLNLGGFADALGYAGGFAGAIMTTVPVLLLRKARANGDQEPVWKVTWQGSRIIQGLLLLEGAIALCYSLGSLLQLLPKGW
ncbi:aromatic amino acid transport family protein [Corynebacterium pseudopelargi]|nr:amino acid permease [Corynebacterium pseudopelargi]